MLAIELGESIDFSKTVNDLQTNIFKDK